MNRQCDTTMKNATRIQRSVRPNISSGPGSVFAVVQCRKEAISASMCEFQVNVMKKD